MKDDKRNKSIKPLSEVIQDMFQSYKLDGKMEELKVIEIWREITGKAVLKRTTKIFLNKNVLHVQISSAPLRNTLSLSRAQLVQRLNESYGKKIVVEILIY